MGFFSDPLKRRPTQPPGRVAIRPRRVEFDWDTAPLVWLPNEPIASYVLSSLNLVIPEGERMMIQAFHEALPQVRDEKLREDMLGFIGQEQLHAEAHDAVMNQVFSRHGINPIAFSNQMQYFFRKTLGVGSSADPRANQQRLIERLGIAASAEHMFAFMGDWALNADLEQFGADPQMLDLYRWHGAEEVEHRAVAHEVAAYFGTGYMRRSISMIITWPIFIGWLLRAAMYLNRNDPSTPNIGYPRFIFGVISATRRGLLPGLSKWFWSGLSTFVPGFHPDSVGSTAQALAYVAQSPAAKQVHA
ncbi:metal-dependent hydrolase [Mycolicibacterium mucogenicum]|uniref:metal-dependent hydrolase n=1 Tax=Mycolicibacterium mucogenicum TaxID=56689 RepID=UPI00226A3CA3|nr:metal-dependent hydrolase [Mycolicibacterium mucogenicum]MCX8564423.1 metal-dependent hydrolase [Mycolicibacterium mucogenicum]